MGWLFSGDRLELVVEPDETRQQFRITGIVFLFETDFVACRERSSRFMKPRQAKDVDSFSLGPQGGVVSGITAGANTVAGPRPLESRIARATPAGLAQANRLGHPQDNWSKLAIIAQRRS
jgi:hypothetical protein